MATRKTGTKKADGNKKVVSKISNMNFTITRAVEFDNGGISFDMSVQLIDDLSISFYRLGIREGKEGSFISFPSYKGSDGNYYHYFYVPMTDELQDKVIQAVYDKLDNQSEAE